MCSPMLCSALRRALDRVRGEARLIFLVLFPSPFSSASATSVARRRVVHTVSKEQGSART